jgi:hypothetical protein
VVTGDPVGFRQLFTNLLENAVRHGGRPDLVVAADLSGGGGAAGPDDLAVGAPGENVGATVDAGAVSLIESADDGSGLPAGAVQQRFFQGNGGVPGASETGDRFGAALATGDFDDNLVVGTPGEDVGTLADAGAVVSLCGSDGVIGGCAASILTQSNPETGDNYGASLAPGNFDGNEFVDLAIGAPGETVTGRTAAGAADARDGALLGLPADPDEPLYFQGNDGVPGTAETGDRFAAALSA